MTPLDQQIINELNRALKDLQQAMSFDSDHLLVIGCSTSEIQGKCIGTTGSYEIAKPIFKVLHACHVKTNVHFVFQCCEHLNRALVIDQKLADQKRYEQVTVRPILHAGGAMATYAYEHMPNSTVVEFIKADGGIDIGDTLIGMHLRHVAVPVRSTVKQIGGAHLVMARTRPKLIGGKRASYPEI
ncbi:MAG: TIGR01440 family protein [Sporolactobacillus sp.]|nr:TIGR01440 family protein [Sporolactobacillus sp.]